MADYDSDLRQLCETAHIIYISAGDVAPLTREEYEYYIDLIEKIGQKNIKSLHINLDHEIGSGYSVVVDSNTPFTTDVCNKLFDKDPLGTIGAAEALYVDDDVDMTAGDICEKIKNNYDNIFTSQNPPTVSVVEKMDDTNTIASPDNIEWSAEIRPGHSAISFVTDVELKKQYIVLHSWKTALSDGYKKYLIRCAGAGKSALPMKTVFFSGKGKRMIFLAERNTCAALYNIANQLSIKIRCKKDLYSRDKKYIAFTDILNTVNTPLLSKCGKYILITNNAIGCKATNPVILFRGAHRGPYVYKPSPRAITSRLGFYTYPMTIRSRMNLCGYTEFGYDDNDATNKGDMVDKMISKLSTARSGRILFTDGFVDHECPLPHEHVLASLPVTKNINVKKDEKRHIESLAHDKKITKLRMYLCVC